MTIEDAVLVEQTLQGDKAAFGQLYDRYARLVRAVCYDTTKDLSQAQDLGQEVFIRAYTKLNKLDDRERFGAWLVSIARNVCREYRRGKVRDRHVLVGLDTPEEMTSKEHASNEQLLDLQEGLATLSEKERMALHVFYLQENDVEKAQAIMNMSRSAFYRLLTKAKDKLQSYMKADDSSQNQED